MFRTGTIYGVNGPVIYLKGNTGFKMSEMVYVGKERLVGEVIALDKDKTTIQVFEMCIRDSFQDHGRISRQSARHRILPVSYTHLLR